MFLRVLAAAWSAYLLGVALFFIFPHQVFELIRSPLLRLWLFGYPFVILVLASGLYVIVVVYRAGMRSAGKENEPE